MLREISVILLLSLPLTALAADYPKPTKSAEPSLIQENNSLAVLTETSMQKGAEHSRHIFGVEIAQLAAERVVLFANEREYGYDTDRARPAVGVTYSYLPWTTNGQQIGVQGGARYTYLETGPGDAPVALHWAVADLSALYRWERAPSDWLKPFAALGVSEHVFIQRGLSDRRTSEARTSGLLTLGASLNVSRAFRSRSPLLWELSARYRRGFGPASDRMDLSSNTFSVALELAL